MIKAFLFLLSITTVVRGYSQEMDAVLATVHYNFKYVNDTSDRVNLQKEELITYLGKNSSFSESYEYFKLSENLASQAQDPKNEGYLKVSINSSESNEYYFLYPAKKELKRLYKFEGNDFLIEDVYPTQDWKLSEETKNIGDYTCQKAEATFKGRKYTAWFTTEIPFPFGPWKLHGLPGLILEAYDDKKEVVFDYAGFDLVEGPALKIGIPKQVKLHKIDDIHKIKKAFEENPEAFYANYAEPVKVEMINGRPKNSFELMNRENYVGIDIVPDESYSPSMKKNNPIELAP
ncbi:GLPGLI family protein [Sphingobacterium hungaricum]|uniref:GLPGLI family protein n=1 Tax=Sphingobacterium hungaricum TaxID=2082723 RepID=A0A928YR66_9SPHI|nr:GLPGLI family protein [Sphingobacterium hungaricum]MBE8713038.1 hypothetical protein [Sphingobacterium hungaricum]